MEVWLPFTVVVCPPQLLFSVVVVVVDVPLTVCVTVVVDCIEPELELVEVDWPFGIPVTVVVVPIEPIFPFIAGSVIH